MKSRNACLVTSSELRANMREMLMRVEAGQALIVTSNGHQIAVVMPIEAIEVTTTHQVQLRSKD